MPDDTIAILCAMTGGQLIAEARKRARITQTELAGRLHTHQPVVARWETERSKPDFETVQRAVRAAGFELSVSIHPFDEHDLSLIRREMRLLPHQRLSGMVEAVRAVAAMYAAARD